MNVLKQSRFYIAAVFNIGFRLWMFYYTSYPVLCKKEYLILKILMNTMMSASIECPKWTD